MKSDALRNKDVLTLTKEIARGKSSGVDTLMKVVLKMNLVKNTDTVEGKWSERAGKAKEANDHILYGFPLRGKSGIVDVRGNFCRTAIFKRAGLAEEAIRLFNDKIYLL